MGSPLDRPVEVFRVHPLALAGAIFLAVLIQTFLPLRLPVARYFDFPLVVTLYFALLRRNKTFAIGLGTFVGLLQDAFGSGLIGMHGMAKAFVAYAAASAGVKFEMDRLLARFLLLAVLVPTHALFLAGLRQLLFERPPPFGPLDLATGVLVNGGLGLLLFPLLDRFRRPT
jgi:rod shape-determining protein MreD